VRETAISTDDLGHVEVLDWVTIPNSDNQIAVIIEEKDDGELVRVMRWNNQTRQWSDEADWIDAVWVYPMEVEDEDPRLPDAQREWSQRQMDAIYTSGWVDGKGEGDEGST